MRWLRQEGEPEYEILKEAAVNFDNRKVALRIRRRKPLMLEDARENCETGIFDFAEVGGDRFNGFLQSVFKSDFDGIFGAGANKELRGILQMSRTEYVARQLDRKEIIVDLLGGSDGSETKYTAPFKIIYRDETFGIVYPSAVPDIPDVSGEYEIYDEFYDRGFYVWWTTAQVEQTTQNIKIYVFSPARNGNISAIKNGSFSAINETGGVEVTLENGKAIFLDLVKRRLSSFYTVVMD